MKNLKILLLLTCAYTGAALARLMNVDSTGAVNAFSGTLPATAVVDTKVLSTNVLMTSCFDEEKKVLYLGDTTGASNATGAYSLLRVNFDDAGTPSVTTLGQLAPAFFQLGVVSIQLLDSGNLLVVVKGTAPALHFCVITNPNLASAAISDGVNSVTGKPADLSPYSGRFHDASDASTSTTFGDILNVMAAGQDSAGNDRIVISVVKAADVHLSAGGSAANNKSLLKILKSTPAGVISNSVAKAYTANDATNELGLYCALAGSSKYNLLGDLVGAAHDVNNGTSQVKFSNFYWDKDLKKLFIGVSSDNKSCSGANGLHTHALVGSFSADDLSLTLDVVSPLDSASPPVTNILSLKTHKAYKVLSMNTLKTAGGHKYLILHIESAATGAWNENATLTHASNNVHTAGVCGAVYAIPLVDAGSGKMAKFDKANSQWYPDFATESSGVNDFDPGAAESVFLIGTSLSPNRNVGPAMDVRALVGGRLLETLQMSQLMDGSTALARNNPLEFSDVRVFGDSVYVVRTAKNEPTTAGIWMSSPMYDNYGAIMAWTPWRRIVSSGWTKAGGSAADVIKDAYLAADGKCYFVAGKQDESAVNVVGSMNWAGPDASSFSSDPLVSQLNSDFSDTGVWTAKEFPAYLTNGLAKTGLAVFASRDKLALAVTGGYFGVGGSDLADATGGGLNTLTDKGAAYGAVYKKDVLTSDKHYKLFTDLDGVGAVYCVEVARSVPLSITTSGVGISHGFVFVGGEKGLAVLRKSNGNGFPANITASALQDLGANLADFSFKKIPDIEGPVIGLASTTGYLYVLTNSKLYRIRLQSVLADYNKLFPDSFDITLAASVPVMFKDGMTVVKAAKTSLANVSSAAGANLLGAGTGGSAPFVYDQNTVVVQPVLEAGAAEYFVSMVGCPNTGPLFVAAIEGDHSNIYAIKNTEAPAVEGSTQDAGTTDADWALLATGNYNVFNSLTGAVSDYKQTVPYHVRKMYLRSIEQLHRSLWGGNPVGEKNGIYKEGPNYDPAAVSPTYLIANLFILSGSVFDLNSKLYGYPIWGNAMSVGGSGVTNLINPQTYMVADQGAFWLGGWDATNLVNTIPGYDGSVALGYLANGLDFTGLPIAYAHADVRTGDAPNVLLFSKGNSSLSSRLELDAKLGSNALVYGSLRLENGCQLVYGYPFGVQRFD